MALWQSEDGIMPCLRQRIAKYRQDMVRLLIPIVAIAIIWLLLFSSFSKRVRISASLALVVLMVFGLWLDTNDKALSTKLVSAEQIVSCGVKATPTYRSNYDLELCLENTADFGTVQRLQMRYSALSCVAATCETLVATEERLSLSLASGQRVVHTENVAFSGLPEGVQELVFSAEVLEVWAARK